LVLSLSIWYSARSQSSKVRWVCYWRDVISIRRRTKWGQLTQALFLHGIGAAYGLIPFSFLSSDWPDISLLKVRLLFP
jgi:hypothetical protein